VRRHHLQRDARSGCAPRRGGHRAAQTEKQQLNPLRLPLIVEACNKVAEASKGVAPAETEAIGKVKSALGVS
jgi:hypothetical protein